MPTSAACQVTRPISCASRRERESIKGGRLVLSIQKHRPEQIVTVLRQIAVQMANGKTVPQACKDAGTRINIDVGGWQKVAAALSKWRCGVNSCHLSIINPNPVCFPLNTYQSQHGESTRRLLLADDWRRRPREGDGRDIHWLRR